MWRLNVNLTYNRENVPEIELNNKFLISEISMVTRKSSSGQECTVSQQQTVMDPYNMRMAWKFVTSVPIYFEIINKSIRMT